MSDFKFESILPKLGDIKLPNYLDSAYKVDMSNFNPLIANVEPKESIVGDIKDEIHAQNDIVSEQVKILKEQNEIAVKQISILNEQNVLLRDNYDKLKEMYEAQRASYISAEKDLEQSRKINKRMMTIAAISMIAAIASPIVTILVSG